VVVVVSGIAEGYTDFLDYGSVDPGDKVPEVPTLTFVSKFSQRGKDNTGRRTSQFWWENGGDGARMKAELEELELSCGGKSNSEIFDREVSESGNFDVF
jgi:hypothetical protein